MPDLHNSTLAADLPGLIGHRLDLLRQVEAIDRDIAQRYVLLAQSSPEPIDVPEIRAEHSDGASGDLVTCAPCGRRFLKPKYKRGGRYVCLPCQYAA